MLQEYSPAVAAPPRRRPMPDARPVAGERLRAHRQRVSRIRKRVIATTLVTFAVLWAVIFVQLVSGNDPALSHKTTVAAKTSSGSGSASGTTSSTTEPRTTSPSSSSGSGTTSSSSGSGTTSPLTTSQS